MTTTNPFFHSKFEKVKRDGKFQYIFTTCYTQTNETLNEKPLLSVDGMTVFTDPDWACSIVDYDDVYNRIPQETRNPIVLKRVFEKWIEDTMGAFVKPPTIETCLNNCSCHLDEKATTADLKDCNEGEGWILQWIPTKIVIDLPNYNVYWAPCYKIPDIPTTIELPMDDKIALSDTEPIEVQNPEKTYVVSKYSSRTIENQGNVIEPAATKELWLQEVPDFANIPFADTSTLRLGSDIEQQAERYRRKIRDLRLKAKLARYRAERAAERFETKFGYYPSEDEEEAQTEAETDEHEYTNSLG